ncbi:hypothetical protein [Maribellus maritimus]|uniref:hypothetical protein n=1 Tax=Maribellus maritimus TaxID=2870838 RepID=UPI001EEB020C|nr:hypothetical protein [Maribellus maritimus]MCG6191429.1 hypothetical protein [Maribellus maritimus]
MTRFLAFGILLIFLGGWYKKIKEERIYWFENETELTNEFEIDLSKSFILIPIVAEKDTLQFIFDTGANQILIFPNEQTNKLKYIKGKPLNSKEGIHNIDGRFIHNLNFHFESINFENVSGIMTDMERFPAEFNSYIKQMGIDGMIGYDILKSFPLQLDFESGRGTVYKNSNAINDDKSGNLLALSFHDNKPYINCKIKSNKNSIEIIKLQLDLGNLGTLELIPSTITSFDIPENAEKKEGYGISGKYEIYNGIIEKLLIGDIEVDSIPTAFLPNNIYSESARNGKIGLEVMKQFNLTIDYPSERLIIKKQ